MAEESVMMTDTFWSEAVGQDAAVSVLEHVASPEGEADLAHAWLITGPPGSGRSNLAYRFAAALIAPTPEERESTYAQVRAHTHPDIEVLTTEGSIIKVEDIRQTVTRVSYSPTTGRYRVILVEDADRMRDYASNAILKVLEEPPPSTIWILCAPTEADLLPTISSRTRSLQLVTPRVEDVARLLTERDGIDPDAALRAARLAQSHIGMARTLALNPEAMKRRQDTIHSVLNVRQISDAMAAAGKLVKLAEADAKAMTEERDAQELTEFYRNLGIVQGGTVPPRLRRQIKDFEEDQKRRAKRSLVDGIDRVFSDVTTLLRDAAMLELGAETGLVNEEFRDEIGNFAEKHGAPKVMHLLKRIDNAREQLNQNVPPALVLESFLCSFLLPVETAVEKISVEARPSAEARS